jgi:CDP-diglyceride synthetase
VDNGPDREEDDLTRTDTPVVRPEPTGPATDRVRIVGAETAAEITSEIPVVPPEEGEPEEPGTSSVRILDETADADVGVEPVAPGQTAVPGGGAAATELPHWTEPPTGQVPAVLSRDPEEGSGSGILPPSWREEDADWTAHEEAFEPSMFSGEHSTLGSLDETHGTDAERRPWEFDLGSVKPGAPSPGAANPPGTADDPITEPVEVAGPGSDLGPEEHRASDAATSGGATTREPIPTADPATGHDMPSEAAGADDADAWDQEGNPADPDPSGRDRPSGTEPAERARRSGLRPTRLRAKRPDQAADAPSAELAGASVTDVPGAGRPKGVAALAAADRTAERASDQEAEAADQSAGAALVAGQETATATTAVPTGSRRRRSIRRPPSDGSRPLRSSNGPYTPEVTGGGPPSPPERHRPDSAGRASGAGTGIGVRVGTGIAVAVVALVAFKIGTVTSLILSLIVVTFAAGECFAVLRRVGYHPATLLGLAGTISLMVGAYAKGVAALPLVMVLVTVFTLVWYLLGIERGSPVAGSAATLLTVAWVSLLGAYAGLLLSPSTFPNRHGIAFLLGAIIATVANDVGALVVGRWIGSRPLAPTISPNKTWEGLIGGAVVTVVVSTIAVGAIHPWTPSKAALLGLVVAVVAPLGDLSESLLKRDLRLKDMGTLLPGHGGVLDRVDALLFVLPATYYLVRALNIG